MFQQAESILQHAEKFEEYFSRVPVFEQRIDNIVGIAYAMDLLDYVQKVREFLFPFLTSKFSITLFINCMRQSHSVQNYDLLF